MLLDQLKALQETCWNNPKRQTVSRAMTGCELTYADVLDAQARLQRFAPYFCEAFPQTRAAGGIVESPLQSIGAMQAALEAEYGTRIPGALRIKLDSHLPVSGSIKARGGVYEVLKTAEDIALSAGYLQPGDDYSVFATEKFRSLLSRYSIAVGSTGNLGLSIGIMSAKLGFRVTVHMSADARQWKKDLLRSEGVEVVEYESDYSQAVKNGRLQAQNDPMCHFVDDENSKTLFLGYAVAALRLKEQLARQSIAVPCGVGGGPGGVCFGLKLVFGEHVHCFFAEPTHAPCMLLGMATGKHSRICVQDIGIDGMTAADGLAVGRASGFVGKFMEPFLDGCYTVSDERLYRFLAQLADSQDIFLEPSALAGMYGPVMAEAAPEFREYSGLQSATHLAWATGGSMVPKEEMEKYYLSGK